MKLVLLPQYINISYLHCMRHILIKWISVKLKNLNDIVLCVQSSIKHIAI